MTVRELIQQLSEILDGDMQVWREDNTWGLLEVDEVWIDRSVKGKPKVVIG